MEHPLAICDENRRRPAAMDSHYVRYSRDKVFARKACEYRNQLQNQVMNSFAVKSRRHINAVQHKEAQF